MATPENNVIVLWPEGAPLALGQKPADIPTLTVYQPEPAKRTGSSILILPGGGYGHLAPHEGEGYANWLTSLGFTAYVLKYRLGSDGYHYQAIVQDAKRGLRTVRHLARANGLDPQKVGVIGSSAGGHLTSVLLTQFDAGTANAADPIEAESSRPDFGILCYPVITMGEYTHQGSKKNFLGENPAAELSEQFSSEKRVTAETPPCFIWHTWEDQSVKLENSLNFAAALRRAGVRFDYHVYQKGSHGLGLGRPNLPAPPWAADCAFWLHQNGWAP